MIPADWIRGSPSRHNCEYFQKSQVSRLVLLGRSYGPRGIGGKFDFLDLTTFLCSSGKLNDKQRELLELQALAKRRIKNARANFADGIKVANETKRDLEWAQKRVR